MMQLLSTVMIVAGTTLIAIVGIVRVLMDLLSMSEGEDAQQQPASGESVDWGNDTTANRSA